MYCVYHEQKYKSVYRNKTKKIEPMVSLNEINFLLLKHILITRSNQMHTIGYDTKSEHWTTWCTNL